ncbi:hypothetical protein ROA7450_00074 [Roseovarius albus]|uniref:HD domain-containing protein n=1 Tax=Roseovarius albus TaxID=1247867 RepID=A0A1X6Y5S4_9RHOB|nr:HD domain-containing protein [Roseovarius albus]SLN11223.1 hypothetical protein ROA7450_00074 [Roseovarius albus]
MLETPEDALNLLRQLDAPHRLIRHLELVGEVGSEITSKLDKLGVRYNKCFVLLGIALHDAGKIMHPEELDQSGNKHEAAGEILLQQNGIGKDLARCCRSHSQYDRIEASFEELLIALSDKLWKGKRVSELELQVIDEIAARLSVDRWELFGDLDSLFEEIAANGDTRLSRSL